MADVIDERNPFDSVAARQELAMDIERMEKLLRHKRRALRILGGPPSVSEGATRFYGIAPLHAVRMLLADKPNGMEEADILRELAEGGSLIGKKRGKFTIIAAMNIALKKGQLVKNGTIVSLGKPGDDTDDE